MQRHYLIIKDNNISYIKFEQLDGYSFKPLNRLNYNDSVTVAKIVVFKPELVEKVLKRKIKRKLNQYLELILSTLNDDDSSDVSNVRAVLNDLTRYKQLIINNYRKYLEDRYLEILLTKISMIEEELKSKLISLLYEEPEEKEETHKRSR